MSNVGKWTAWYENCDSPWPYGDTTSYEIGAAWLAGCALIEDWGCGTGWLRKLLPPDQYRGLDGTASPGCDAVVDLVAYRSIVPGIFLRHVLEHNDAWAQLLDNALASFTERMVLILFTPERPVTEAIALHPDLGVPDIAFRLADLTDRFPPNVTCTVHRISSATQYGAETILLIERARRGGDMLGAYPRVVRQGRACAATSSVERGAHSTDTRQHAGDPQGSSHHAPREKGDAPGRTDGAAPLGQSRAGRA